MENNYSIPEEPMKFEIVVCPNCYNEWQIMKGVCTICPKCGCKIGNCDE